jgi:ABC-type Fe3+ transport system permease subunit
MLWNSLAAFASLVAVITWIVQFYVKLQYNVLQREEVANGGWSSDGKANIGHSFWLVVIAAGFFMLNVVIVHLLMRKRNKGSSTTTSTKKQLMMDSKPNGNLMLY